MVAFILVWVCCMFSPVCDGNIIQNLFRVTRAVFAFAELTNTDAGYSGPEFDFDKIIKELMNKVRQRVPP